MAQVSFPFLRLPPEIRDEVYRQVVVLGIKDTNDLGRLVYPNHNYSAHQTPGCKSPVYRNYVLIHGESPLVVDPERTTKLAGNNPHRTRANLLATSRQIKREIEHIMQLCKATEFPFIEFRDFTAHDMSSWCERFGENHTPREFAITNFLPCVRDDRDAAQPRFHHFCVVFNIQEWKDMFDDFPVWPSPRLQTVFFSIATLEDNRDERDSMGPDFCQWCCSRLASVINVALREDFLLWQRLRRVDMTRRLLQQIHAGIVKLVADNRHTRAQWSKYLKNMHEGGAREG